MLFHRVSSQSSITMFLGTCYILLQLVNSYEANDIHVSFSSGVELAHSDLSSLGRNSTDHLLWTNH